MTVFLWFHHVSSIATLYLPVCLGKTEAEVSACFSHKAKARMWL